MEALGFVVGWPMVTALHSAWLCSDCCEPHSVLKSSNSLLRISAWWHGHTPRMRDAATRSLAMGWDTHEGGEPKSTTLLDARCSCANKKSV